MCLSSINPIVANCFWGERRMEEKEKAKWWLFGFGIFFNWNTTDFSFLFRTSAPFRTKCPVIVVISVRLMGFTVIA